ncbi:uncharacterized protein H6S33_003748 [Morchella sextelata]|uniref:uncharacterized protein n=1 Tax=Morchella sextelata TaxID=1174677 RepID=UPI001D04559B|nr:uncharacterized protein H6S33_003748 [Morchella sextelata]KAH0606087.1 hypothetical protein H6S33_003748 [Morchella sextelata]
MEAPYGYTATGRIRKKPIKGTALLAAPVNNPQPEKPEKFIRCPVTTCNKDFQHRKDPHKAVWQHLLHHANSYVGDPDHKAAYAAIKEERKVEAGDKKTREKRNSARWRARNVRKAKRSSAMGTAKRKFEIQLRRAGEFTEEALKKLIDDKMAEWDLNN